MTAPTRRIPFTPQMARALENVASMLRGRGLDRVCEVCIQQMLAEVTSKQIAADTEQVLLQWANMARVLRSDAPTVAYASIREWVRAEGYTKPTIETINSLVSMIRKNVAVATILRDAAALIRAYEAAGTQVGFINAGGLQYAVTAAAHKNFPNYWEKAAQEASSSLSWWLQQLQEEVVALDQWMKQPGVDADGAAFVVESCADQVASI